MSRWTRCTVAGAGALLLLTLPLFAQDGIRKLAGGAESQHAPPAPQGATDASASLALEAARAELEQFTAEHARRTAERGAEIARLQQHTFDLTRQEQEQRTRLRQLFQEEVQLSERMEFESARLQRLQDQASALHAEVLSQAQGLRERLEGSLTALEHPELASAAQELLTRESPAPEQAIAELLDLGHELLEQAGRVSVFETPIQLSGEGGRVEPVQLLRLGLLTGLYHHTPSGECGLLLPKGTADDLLQGSARGLTAAQRASIAQAVANPASASNLPLDVSGGLGIMTLQARDSLVTWFEKGGEFMWALLAVAAFAALLVLERCVVLTFKSLGIGRVVSRTLALVDTGKVDEALACTDRAGGPTGRVLHAAIVHHGQGQSVLEEAVQEALLQHTTPFHARLGFIALCAAVSPLLGLLGTVTGMIETFRAVTALGTSDPRNMAGGIAVALITTQAGLYIAIPCLMFRGALGALADSAVGKIEAGAMSVIVALLGQEERSAAVLPELRSAVEPGVAHKVKSTRPEPQHPRADRHLPLRTETLAKQPPRAMAPDGDLVELEQEP